MPLIYGEGDNAIRRLRKEINNQFGSVVATRLGSVAEVGSQGLYRRPVSPTDVDESIGQPPELDQIARVLRSDDARPAKRVRACHDANTPGSRNNHSSGSTTINISHMVAMSNHVQYSGQEYRDQSMIVDKDKYVSLLKSLLFDRIDFRVNNVKKALLSTCEWLFRHQHFRTWDEGSNVNAHNGFLWIKGKPGCGKSTLMKAALERARKRRTRDIVKRFVVSYFFNARASALLEKSSLGLYRTVVHHLLSSCPPLGALFMNRFALKNPGSHGEEWTAEELQDFLSDIVESNESFSLCLFIDALDEAEYEDDVRHMISFFIQLSDRALAAGGSHRLQICLSSRHYPSISVGRGLSLVVEDQSEHGEDIEVYITKQLTCLDGPEKDDLRIELLNKSARIFLWVVLVVEMLNKLDDYGASLSDMRARLKTIPAGLNELFKEILVKSDHEIETSILFFQWMVFRMRPLEPAELFVAMEHSRAPHDSTWILTTDITVPSPDRLARFILNCSRGLVEVVEVAPSQQAVVQFIHETVREFLLKENGLISMIPALSANLTGISHEILRTACLRCISRNKIPTGYEHYCEDSHKNYDSWKIFRSGMRLEMPFLDYAILHLFDHADQAQKYDISQQTFLKYQVDTNGLWLDPHRRWWNVLERYKSRKIKSDVTLAYFITERQHWNLLPVSLGLSNVVNTICGRYGSVLNMAAYYGVLAIVQMLFDIGADVNLQGGRYGGNALQAAVEGGHERIAEILIDKVTDLKFHSQSGHYNDTLCSASRYGYQKIVQILLERGAKSNDSV